MKRFIQFYLYGEHVFVGELSEGMEFLEKLVPVEKDGYGRDAKYIPNEKKGEIEFTFIHEDQLIVKEEDKMEVLKTKLARAEEQYNKSNTDRYTAQNKVKELEKELEILRSVCPTTHVGEPKDETNL